MARSRHINLELDYAVAQERATGGSERSLQESSAAWGLSKLAAARSLALQRKGGWFWCCGAFGSDQLAV